MTTTTASRFLFDAVEPRYVDGPAARYAYRRFGKNGAPPLVMCMRFRGTIDHWDPALLDLLAAEREVITVVNVGTASSTGTTPRPCKGSVTARCSSSRRFGLSEVDALGWSMVGYVAEIVTLDRPDLVRRLVLAGTGPGGVPDQPQPLEKTWQIGPKPVLEDEDYLYLFFPKTEVARAVGLASLRRLDCRLDRSHAEVLPDQVKAQITAIQGNNGLWDGVPELEHPVLVATALMPADADECPIAGTMRPELTVRSGRLRGL